MVDGKGLGCGYLLADTGRVFWNRDEAQLLNWWVQEAERAKNLTTVEGQRVMVLTAGTINDGPGPDILDCHLLLDDLEYSGAVEMHLDASSWSLNQGGGALRFQLIAHAGDRPGKPLDGDGFPAGNADCLCGQVNRDIFGARYGSESFFNIGHTGSAGHAVYIELITVLG